MIKRSYAYYYVTARGTYPKGGSEDILQVQKDSIVSPVSPVQVIPSAKNDTFIVVYIETSTKKIVWDTAWQNENYFLITALPLKTNPLHIGFIKGGGEMIISPAKGNFLFELQLSKNTWENSQPVPITGDQLLLKGHCNKRTITWKTAILKELIPLPPS